MTRSSLSSRETAEFYGISNDTLLLYERESIVSPLRVGEERYFTSRDRVRIEIILKGQRLGFSLREIKTLIITHLPVPEALTHMQVESQIATLEEEKNVLQRTIDNLRARITRKP